MISSLTLQLQKLSAYEALTTSCFSGFTQSRVSQSEIALTGLCELARTDEDERGRAAGHLYTHHQFFICITTQVVEITEL